MFGTNNTSPVYMGRGYGVADMSYYLYNALNVTYKNKITYYQSYDIVNYTTASAPYRITSVTIRKFGKNWATGIESYASDTLKLNSSVFIDASQEGRLARKVNSVATVGRCDWTANRITNPTDRSEFTSKETKVGKQQAATLMLMMNNINDGASGMGWEEYTFDNKKKCMAWGGAEQVRTSEDVKAATLMLMMNNINDGASGMGWEEYTFDNKKKCMAWGGAEQVRTSEDVKIFNETYGTPIPGVRPGMYIKPLNAARDGYSSENWWVNALLIFDVDGRAHEKTYGTPIPGVRPGMYIKPLNAARDGYSSENWWVNALLIFDVDGRAHEKDKGTAFYPNDMLSDSWNVDDAWRAVRNCLNNDETFRIRLRK